MAEKLIEIIDPQLFQSGIVKSMHPLQVPLWIDGQNVVFEDGAVKKAPGNAELGFDALTLPLSTYPITGMIDVLRDDAPALFYGDYDALYSFDGTAHLLEKNAFAGALQRAAFAMGGFQSSAFQGNLTRFASLWSMESWGEWALASNGANEIQINKTIGGGFSNLAGSAPAFAQVIVRLKNYLLAFNTDLGKNYFEWCDTDDVENWTGEAAGNLPIRDLDSEIVAACRLGDVVAVYSNNNMAVVQYIGPPFYFGAKKVLEGIGAVGKHAVVQRENMNYGLSKQGFWETDGTRFDYISPPLQREWLEANINWGSASKVAGYLNEDRSLIEWGIPINGSSENNIVVCYNFDNKTWSYKKHLSTNLFDLGITCGLKKGIFSYPIFGLADGYIMQGEVGTDTKKFGYTWATDSWVQSKPMPLEDTRQWKTLEYVIAAFKKIVDSGVKLYVGISSTFDGAITWSSAITASADLEPDYFPTGLDGKYIHFRVKSGETFGLASAQLGASWGLAGLQVFGNFTGQDTA